MTLSTAPTHVVLPIAHLIPDGYTRVEGDRAAVLPSPARASMIVLQFRLT